MQIKIRVLLAGSRTAGETCLQIDPDKVGDPAFRRGSRDSVLGYPPREDNLAYQVGWASEHLKRGRKHVHPVIVPEKNLEEAYEKVRQALRK